MSKSGDLYVGVLGTEPSLFTAPRPEARQVNYEETDIEMAALNSIIKTAQSEDTGTTSSNVREELTLKVEASAHIESCFYNTMVVEDENLPMTRITISLSASSPLTKVRVGIDVMEPLVVTKTSFVVNSLSKLISRNFCQNIKKWNFNIFLSLKFHVKSHFTLCIHIYIIQKSKLIFAKNCVDLGHCYTLWKSYSVSTLKTTIFREIISLVICSKGQFQIHFSQLMIDFTFWNSYGGKMRN